MQSMLPGVPWLLAHKSMLPINQPRKISLYGNDYVMWRDANDAVQALPNACPHMGAMLSAGWCEARNDGSSEVVCPFHALAFDAQGRTVLPGSNKQTLSQLAPLELIIQGDLVWSYGGHEPVMPIPDVLNQYAQQYDFIGATADTTVPTSLLTMLLNMHDYNHQNGTHRDLFKIESVEFDRFDDNGWHSEAWFRTPRRPPTLRDMLANPAVLLMPKVIEAHLENCFPHLVVLHGEVPIGSIKQVHIFVPESATQTRTYILMYGKARHPLFNLAKPNVLKLAKTVVEQDADILAKIYPDSPQKIKLNNEVGMDWVRRNFREFPTVKRPVGELNFSR